MHIRTADRSDADAIREVAQRSFRPSRVVRPSVIDHLLTTRFGEADVDSRLGHDETVCVIAEADGEQVGFAEGTVGDAAVDWLHVVPEFRGEGVGSALFERLSTELDLSSGGRRNDGRQDGGRRNGSTDELTGGSPHASMTAGGDTELRLDRDDLTAGTEEPFVGVVDDLHGHYGVLCTNCETVIETGDVDEGFRCPGCGNERRF